ncbi:alpha/beta hydrolase [Marinomonas sp. TW1]|uniref:COG3904 family protein n=1 Tax=Marinomonas sp. TW1 TaxID=1561203 RepID=UPI0009EF4C3B|nr:alpha/beta hydrolase [Marinomonas sp. TW1]
MMVASLDVEFIEYPMKIETLLPNVLKWLSLVVFFLLSACATIDDQSLLEADSLSLEVEDNTAYLSGVLDSNLVSDLTAFLAEHPNVTDLVLVDVPGSTDQQATMDSARLIRRLGLNTHIAPTGYVLSGGVDLFLGGVERTIGAGAGVGIHAWSDGTRVNASSANVADPIHATYVNFYLEMGVPDRFYWFSLTAAPADRVYFLSPEEVYDLQLATQ